MTRRRPAAITVAFFGLSYVTGLTLNLVLDMAGVTAWWQLLLCDLGVSAVIGWRVDPFQVRKAVRGGDDG